MATVLFRKLRLSGFGPYRDTVTCRLTHGVNTLIARNEAGKSSLVAGLIATIFGLPGKSDPGQFGQARFKNRYGPARFEGELEFEADGVVYNIWRDFESHKIALSVFDNGKQKNLVSGEHNPLATKGNAEYVRWLKELFGIVSRELFEATFCVTQPLPESTKKDGQGQKELDKDVQELLSGTGVTFAKAQEVLLFDLKKQTRFTRERGLTRVDQRTDGDLEVIEARIDDLSERLEKARGVADSLEVVRERLSFLQGGLDAKATELESKRDIRNALTEWRRLKSEYDRAVLDLNRIRKAYGDAEFCEREITKESDELKTLYPEFESYPEFENAPGSVDKDLDALIALRQELSSLGETISRIESQLDERKSKKKQLEEDISSLRNWGELGNTPQAEVRNRQRIASDLMDEWEKFEADLAEQAECEEILDGELALIDEAEDEERMALSTYETNLTRLEREKSEAWRRLQDVEARFREFEASCLEYNERYEDLECLPQDALSILGKKLQLMRSMEFLRHKSSELKKELLPPVWARIGAMLVLAVSGWACSGLVLAARWGVAPAASGSGSGAWIPIAFAAVLGWVGWFAAKPVWALAHSSLRKEERELLACIATCKSDMEEIDASLGEPISSADEMELGRFQERLSQRDREKMILDEKKRRLPPEEGREEAEDAFLRSQKKYHEFMELTGRFREQFSDISAAYDRWNQTERRKADAARRVSEFATQNFGCDSTAVSACAISSPGVSCKWREIAELVRIAVPGEDMDSIGELVEFVRKSDDAWWMSIQGEAEQYEALRREEEQLSAVMTDGEMHLFRAQEERKQKEELYDETASSVEAIVDAAGGDPKLARERWSKLRDCTIALENKRALLKKVLSDHKVASLDELSLVVTKCQTEALGAEDRWQKLIQAKPGLPEKQAADDPEKVDGYVRSLDAAILALEKEVDELQEAHRKCRYELGDLERENPINIAQAELELKEEKERRERIRLQADALTLAYLELAHAIREFHESHRIRLEQATMRHFQRITGVSRRAVTIDDDFRVSLDVDGRPCDIAQLSKGAQDQLYIALRLAISDLLSSDINLPLIFDDPFVTSDSKRLDNIGIALSYLADERQIIVLSHNGTLADWGAPMILDHM